MIGKIPVTIITGYLGAGKTTLINNLIKKHPEKKFAIIENEFGEIGLDGSLILRTDEIIFELSNGCICCNLNNDFHDLLNRLLIEKHDFDHLIIETTGIADPASIVNAFLSDRSIANRFIMDAVICLVDAVNIEDQINSEPEVRKQLTIADIILVNKADSVSPKYSEEIKSKIEDFNQQAKIYHTTQSVIPEFTVLDTYQYLGKAIEQSILSYKNLAFIGKNKLQHDMQSVGISIPGDLEKDRFLFWFETILFFAKYRPYRVKAILSFKDIPERCILQSIKDYYTLEKMNIWQPNEERYSKLIFIGRDLDKLKIEENINKFRIK